MSTQWRMLPGVESFEGLSRCKDAFYGVQLSASRYSYLMLMASRSDAACGCQVMVIGLSAVSAQGAKLVGTVNMLVLIYNAFE